MQNIVLSRCKGTLFSIAIYLVQIFTKTLAGSGGKKLMDEERNIKENFKKLNNYIWIKTVWILTSAVSLGIGILGCVIVNLVLNEITLWGRVLIVFTILSLVSFIAALVFFIRKDPSNNLSKYKLHIMLKYCSMSDRYTVYSEVITYITLICYRIIYNSNIRKDMPEKVIAKLWRELTREISTEKNQKQYKDLSKDLFSILQNSSDTINNKELEDIKVKFKDACTNSDTVNLFMSFIKLMKDNLFLVLNLSSLVMILLGFIATLFEEENKLLDTFLYGVASLQLVIYAIMSEVKKKLDISDKLDMDNEG